MLETGEGRVAASEGRVWGGAMSQGLTLAKGSFSKEFAERLTDYYRFADGPYADRRLRQWKGDGGVILYEAQKDSGPVGWIVYRPDSSAIEEIILRKEDRGCPHRP